MTSKIEIQPLSSLMFRSEFEFKGRKGHIVLGYKQVEDVGYCREYLEVWLQVRPDRYELCREIEAARQPISHDTLLPIVDLLKGEPYPPGFIADMSSHLEKHITSKKTR